MKVILFLVLIISSGFITSCASTQGEHTYVNGKCITCFNNPLTGQPLNYEPASEPESQAKEDPKPSINGCSKNDKSYHPRDSRWCSNLYLSGASFSEEITYQELLSVPVDLAYIRAKRHLKFKDPDDKLNSRYNESYEWDGIAGTYYGVKGRFGGPLMKKLYFIDYDLQIEKINDARSKIQINYRVYSRGVDPNEFRKELVNKMIGKG